MAPVLALLQEKYPDEVRVVYRHFPLVSIHGNASLAAQAAEAAGVQGKFWEMHDLLFERQGEWAALPEEEFASWLNERAAELDLEVDSFVEVTNSAAKVGLVEEAWEKGQEMGIPYTPFLVVEKQVWPKDVPASLSNLSVVVELTLIEQKQFTSCPPMVIDPLKQYVATLHTDKGDIAIELFTEKAPLAVNNFVFLSQNGWYDGVTFHRVLPGFMAQAGDPTGTGFGGPGYAFINEISTDLNFDRAGLLAMANAGPDTNGSQFFITYAPVSRLDGDYTIFGQVIEGMHVVESLAPRDPSQSSDLPPGDLIESVTIEER